MIVKNDLSLCLHLEKLTQRLSDNQCFYVFRLGIRFARPTANSYRI
jgi:hypothetical protein